MPAKKKAARKKAVTRKPAHPLMINQKSWNREAVMDFVCDRTACSSLGVGTILNQGIEINGKHYDLPAYSQIMKWLEDSEVFQERYARAKAAQADYMADEMLEIADDGTNDFIESYGKDGESLGVKLDGEHVQRSRLRIDTRKWLMGKLKPKKYGDKVDLNHGGQEDNPLLVLARSMQGSALPIKEED